MIYVWWLNTYLKYCPYNMDHIIWARPIGPIHAGKYGNRTGGFSVYSIYQADIPKISFGLFKID